MVLRWVAVGLHEATKGFRGLEGHEGMPKLVAALRARDDGLRKENPLAALKKAA